MRDSLRNTVGLAFLGLTLSLGLAGCKDTKKAPPKIPPKPMSLVDQVKADSAKANPYQAAQSVWGPMLREFEANPSNPDQVKQALITDRMARVVGIPGIDADAKRVVGEQLTLEVNLVWDKRDLLLAAEGKGPHTGAKGGRYNGSDLTDVDHKLTVAQDTIKAAILKAAPGSDYKLPSPF